MCIRDRIRLSQFRHAGMGRLSRAGPYAQADRAEAQRRDRTRHTPAGGAVAAPDGGDGATTDARSGRCGRFRPGRCGALDRAGRGGRSRQAESCLLYTSRCV